MNALTLRLTCLGWLCEPLGPWAAQQVGPSSWLPFVHADTVLREALRNTPVDVVVTLEFDA